jgi:3-oxoacyl-[acyl-carrier-protein] synthase II
VSIADALDLDGDGDHDGRADPKRYSRAALFGVIAAREAWRDAGLRAGEAGAGVLIGSGGGGIDVGEKQYEDFFTTGGRHVTPYAIAIGIWFLVAAFLVLQDV